MSSPTATDAIRIGVTLPRSGRYARSARITYDNTYRFWVDQVNRAGGILGRRVELIVYDDGSNPQEAAGLYEHLIAVDHVDLLLGPCHSEMVEAIAPIIERERKLLLQGSGSSHELFQKGRKYLFLCWSGCDFDYPSAFFAWLASLPDSTRPITAALAYSTGRIGSAVALGTRYGAERYGIKMVVDERIPRGTFDYDSLFQRIKQARPEVILVGLDHATGDDPLIRSATAYRKAGLDHTILWLSDNPSPDDPTDLFDHTFMRTTWAPQSPDPESRMFTEAYASVYGAEPEYHHAGGYACCQVLEQAVEAVGSCDHERLRTHLLASEFDTVMGRIRFKENGLPDATMQLSQWVGGELRIVYPEDSRTREAVLP